MNFQEYLKIIDSTDVLDIIEKKKTILELKATKLQRYYKICQNDSERETIFQYVENAFSILKPLLENITVEEFKAISKYGRKFGSNSYEINSALRNNIQLSYEQKMNIQLIDNLMKRFQLQEEIVVYRALKPIENYNFEEMLGKSFTDLGYMSTSLNKKSSYAYFKEYPVVLEITLPIGTSCLYVEWFKGSNDESELLLARGTTVSIGNFRKEIINGYDKIVFSCCVMNQISKMNLNEENPQSRMHL